MTQKTKKPITTFDVPAKYLEKIRLSGRQREFYEAIKQNQIIFCTGPAGCLTKNEKLRVYVLPEVPFSEDQAKRVSYEDECITINVKDLYDNYQTADILIDTPDGWQMVGDIVTKERECIKLTFSDDSTLECSTDHLIETSEGWIQAIDLSSDHQIVSKTDIRLINKEKIDETTVYDLEVLHPNHRYWTLNGVSSHNTAKTYSALYTALSLFSESKYKQIFLVKPIKESGENLGFLPGDIKDKTDPYLESFISNIDKLIPEELRKQMFEWHQFEFKPLAYMRGATYDNVIIIADEIQNATHEQLILALTRLGKNSKLIILGDTKQVDINRKNSGLMDFINMLDGINGVYHHVFERSDIVRNKILIEITDRYDEWLSKRIDKK